MVSNKCKRKKLSTKTNNSCSNDGIVASGRVVLRIEGFVGVGTEGCSHGGRFSLRACRSGRGRVGKDCHRELLVRPERRGVE